MFWQAQKAQAAVLEAINALKESGDLGRISLVVAS
jgi:hypothetical protein